MFQDYRLLPWRTVRENVALPFQLTGRGESPEEVLKLVGMPTSKPPNAPPNAIELEHADRYPHQLSGGMRARVAIARALAQDAE